MMILNKKKIKLSNEDANTRRNPNSTSVIYLATVKVAQCREVAANRIETEEAKKITAKKIATRKVHIQLNISEAFDMCINSMNSLYSYTTNEENLIQLIQQ